jgi:hypothetical protein
MNRRTILAILISIAAMPCAVQAELGTDIHVQSDSDAIRLDIDRRTFEEIQSLLNQGYPAVSVMLHGVSMGMSINDVVYLAVKSHPQRAKELYDTAVSLLPSLPGWAIQEEDGSDRYYTNYAASELGAQPTVAEVAQRFFEQNMRLSPFPDWYAGGYHIKVKTDELAGLLKDSWWYLSGNLQPNSPRSAPNRPIFISLYGDRNEIVIDGGADLIRSAQRQGVRELPVVFVYNDMRTGPISRYNADVKVKEIVDDFFERGRKLTAVPEWRQVGDYHMIASVAELLELVDTIDKKDVDPARWSAITRDIKNNGFNEPLLISLFNSGDGRIWANEPDRVVAAAELGVDQVPVVFLYHDIGRPPCGQPIRTTALICSAALAAGADPSICQLPPGARPQGYVAPGGGAGFPPLPPPTTTVPPPTTTVPPPTTTVPPPTTTIPPPPPPSPVLPERRL